MKSLKIKKILLALSVGGVLFSGYLSAVKFFSKVCALHESCAYFLGYPACYYGFIMFLLLLVFNLLLLTGKMAEKTASRFVSVVSFAGILFAGYFTLSELPLLFARGFGAYFLGLPTCALGLIFYVVIFILSLF